ncbi:MAG: hypothetical protein M1820_000395 [Bogoriella megaspora]|nr:MAG: hypothetical protein M1820_000395 [Bogoriella megaspora]
MSSISYSTALKTPNPTKPSNKSITTSSPPPITQRSSSPISTTATTPPSQHPPSPLPELQPYILTFLLSPTLTHPLSHLRHTYFPPHLPGHSLPPHITLFHALPSRHLPHLTRIISTICQKQTKFPLRVCKDDIIRLGRKGVGIKVPPPQQRRLRGVRNFLMERWSVEIRDADEEGEGPFGDGSMEKGEHWEGREGKLEWMTEQDRSKGWSAHFTIMNKETDPERVERCYEGLREGFEGAEGRVEGLVLWRYEVDGRWTLEREFEFGG